MPVRRQRGDRLNGTAGLVHGEGIQHDRLWTGARDHRGNGRHVPAGVPGLQGAGLHQLEAVRPMASGPVGRGIGQDGAHRGGPTAVHTATQDPGHRTGLATTRGTQSQSLEHPASTV